MNYQETLEYLYACLPMYQRVGASAFKKDLTNTFRFLEAIGNPHFDFRSVHIAGTNGKGTSAHAISAIMQSAGYKTGLYTSPHLKSFTERIRVDGVEVPESFVVNFTKKHRTLIEEIKPSFFETTVVMAFEYFAQEHVEIAIIETGLGGRLDSTNVITPVVSLITMIGYDHADMLGETLPEIAGEKAGIIKPKVPVIIGADQPDLMPVFKKKAESEGAPLMSTSAYNVYRMSENLTHQAIDVYLDNHALFKDLQTDITAAYFVKNIPGILATVDQLNLKGFEINKTHIREGLGAIKKLSGLKGRWQILGRSPAIVADVSHNEPGLQELLMQVDALNVPKLHIIIGMVRDKKVDRILNLLPSDASYYYTQSEVPRSLPAKDLKAIADQMGYPGVQFDNVNLAIEAAKKKASPDDLILICGSTFVVAEIEDL